ncbi:hypothetical protein [Sphingomonas sp. KR3-1]|uniref:hypothetical protein n=1 Tax=Sphingomonas sp. KR3-1 TaxID=3156611 RepID=UPI0032B5C898
MALSPITQARAIALFNPTPGQPGFLQPLLAGPQGDNQSYIQIVSEDGLVAGFMAVPWPERDVVLLSEEQPIEVGADSIWAFAFPGEAPRVLHWAAFREAMGTRIAQGALADHPLLQFDLVDTLNLAQAKRETYRRAFDSYREIDRSSADHWRDRAILEPALLRALAGKPGENINELGDLSPHPRLMLRARLQDDHVVVTVPEFATGLAARLSDAYRQLASDLPELFPRDMTVHLEEHRSPVANRHKPATMTVVLVGRVQAGLIDRERWSTLGVDVVGADHFRPTRGRAPHASLTILLAVQTEWRELVEVGSRLDERTTLLVSLSTSAMPLIRDLEFQSKTSLPTISFFAPFATSTVRGRDPVQLIAPLIDIFIRHRGEKYPSHIFGLAPHRLLMREPVRMGQDITTISCRLAARAIRAGAVLHGHGELYGQSIPETVAAQSGYLLAPLFDLTEPLGGRHLDKRQPALLLLVERTHRYETGENHYRTLMDALGSLLELRGWEVSERHERYLTIGTSDRRFNITLVDSGHHGPEEDPAAPTPGLGRAPLVVVHVQPRREDLLIGNRGQFLHIAMEDIARMVPGTGWIWPVLRRHLLERAARPTLAALRLSAALVVEAIHTGRAYPHDFSWGEIEATFGEQDPERFVDFFGAGIQGGQALLRASIKDSQAPNGRRQVLLELGIDEEGPFVAEQY